MIPRIPRASQVVARHPLARGLTIWILAASPLLALGQSAALVGDATRGAKSDGKSDVKASTEASREFANRLYVGIEVVARRYYRELDEDQLIAAAVRGLYKSLSRPIPKDVDERLSKAGDKLSDKLSLDDQVAQALKILKGPSSRAEKLALLAEARDGLGERKDLVGHDVAAAMKAVLEGLDGSTAFLSSEKMARLRLWQAGPTFGELGLDVERRAKDNAVVVTMPVRNGPARVAGIRVGDVVVRADLPVDENGKPVAQPRTVLAAALDDAGLDYLLAGKIGDKVRLVVERDGKPLEFDLVRAAVKRESYAGIERDDDDSWKFVLDGERGIFYLRIVDYHRTDLARDIGQRLSEFRKQGMKGLVLDLRLTGHGYIDSTIGVAEQFLDGGELVTFRWRGNGLGQRTGKRGGHLDFPMACLVSKQAGTCSEILAACLQDAERATIVGERTSGVASVQNYAPFEGGMLRITTSHAFRPNGKPLDRTVAQDAAVEGGVIPDAGFALELSNEERNELKSRLFRQMLPRTDAIAPPVGFRDRQRDAALELLRRKIELPSK